MQWTQSSAKAILCAALTSLGAIAAHSQTSVAASLYGAFNGATSGSGTQQSPANAAGGLFELRHIKNPLVGYEAAYSYNRANQNYLASPASVCGAVCQQEDAASVSSNAHEISGAWVVSVPLGGIRPFALAGGGVLLNMPSAGSVITVTCPTTGTGPCSTSSTPTSTSTKAVFVYGAGLDWSLLPHIGLRLQYRGNLYKAPDLVNAFSSTNAFTQTAEPMIGIYFRL